MKLIRVFFYLINYVLVKTGQSRPQRYNWHDVWVQRGSKADSSHVEILDGRPNQDEMNAMAAVNQQLTRLSFLPTMGKWLDIGIGSGVMHNMLKTSHPDTEGSIGCDYSYPSLCYCKKTYALPVVNCSAEHLAFHSECFAAILLYSVSHYMSGHKNLMAVITELERVLKPGGIILIGDVLSYEKLSLNHFNPRWFFPNFKKVKRDIRKLDLDITILPQPMCAPYRDQRVDWVLLKSDKLDACEAE